MVMSNWRSGGCGLHIVCFNTQLYRTARDRILTNHSRVSQLVIRQHCVDSCKQFLHMPVDLAAGFGFYVCLFSTAASLCCDCFFVLFLFSWCLRVWLYQCTAFPENSCLYVLPPLRVDWSIKLCLFSDIKKRNAILQNYIWKPDDICTLAWFMIVQNKNGDE